MIVCLTIDWTRYNFLIAGTLYTAADNSILERFSDEASENEGNEEDDEESLVMASAGDGSDDDLEWGNTTTNTTGDSTGPTEELLSAPTAIQPIAKPISAKAVAVPTQMPNKTKRSSSSLVDDRSTRPTPGTPSTPNKDGAKSTRTPMKTPGSLRKEKTESSVNH